MSKREAIHHLGLSEEKPVIAVIGGSQGSKALNRVTAASLKYLTVTLGCQIVWQTGPIHHDSLKHFEREYSSVRLFPFIEEMGVIYSAADLVVSRAGALALAEISYCGKPSVLVPFAGAAADHQTKNAEDLKKAGAAVVLNESELSPKRFETEIEALISDGERLEQMGRAAASVSVPGAADRIMDEILGLMVK